MYKILVLPKTYIRIKCTLPRLKWYNSYNTTFCMRSKTHSKSSNKTVSVNLAWGALSGRSIADKVLLLLSWCLMSSDVIWHIRDKLWPMPKHDSIRKVYACLAVTCHLHFWQNDRDLLRATAVTRGWNGYRNKSQHRKSTLEKKILPPFPDKVISSCL